MTGAGGGSSGHTVTGLQSNSLGHSTLNENAISARRGSKFCGGGSSTANRTRRSR